MVVAHCPTYAASSMDKQNNVEVMHLCWDLEGVKKNGTVLGCPPSTLYSWVNFSHQFFPNFLDVGVKWWHFKDLEVHTIHQCINYRNQLVGIYLHMPKTHTVSK